ncbi:MAG: sarcosine oxidase subunit gamma [Paracoccaceae bacterium]
MPEGVSAPVGVTGRVIEGEDVRIEEAACAMASLKADLADAAVAEAVVRATGCAVPAALSAETAGEAAALWFAPDELLLIAPVGRAAAMVADLDAALAGHHALALDASAARVSFALDGPAAAEVLAKGCPVDLRDAAFPVGQVRRTHMGQVAVALWREGEGRYRLFCFRSVSGYVADWLADAAAAGGRVGHFA